MSTILHIIDILNKSIIYLLNILKIVNKFSIIKTKYKIDSSRILLHREDSISQVLKTSKPHLYLRMIIINNFLSLYIHLIVFNFKDYYPNFILIF